MCFAKPSAQQLEKSVPYLLTGTTPVAPATVPRTQKFSSVRFEMERRGSMLAIPWSVDFSLIFLFNVNSDQKTEEASRKVMALSSISLLCLTLAIMKDHTTKPNSCKQLDAKMLSRRWLCKFVTFLPLISLKPYACSLFKCHIYNITS